jgi:Tfp pilus assembly protein PilN
MPKKKSAINLLPQEEFESSTLGRLLRWAMTSFRYIVIVTEMVVMGAFLSRFWLDARNSDLNDTLAAKTVQIESQSEFENEFRGLQESLRIFQELAGGIKSSEMVSKIVTKIPTDVTLLAISFQSTSVQVKGIAGSEFGIAQFISNLKADSSLKEIALGQINSAEDNPSLTVFDIKITF